MERVTIAPRANYKEKLSNLNFNFDENYWVENAYYKFDLLEIHRLEYATNECYKMYIAAVEHVIQNNLWNELRVPKYIVPALIESWQRDDLSLYGRFDFAYVDRCFKLLEFNADTPTSIYEASVIQWDWKEDMFANKDQFNSIHEALVESWQAISKAYGVDTIHFTCLENDIEDLTSTAYILETATQAGLHTTLFDIEQLEYCAEDKMYCISDSDGIKCLFKLYPYEWMFEEDVDRNLIATKTKFIEPLWKAVLSNKYMLKIVYDLFPNSEHILKCDDKPLSSGNFCKKPIFSREGANVTLVKDGVMLENSSGDYGKEGYIFQQLVDIPSYDGMYPVIGSWIVGGVSCGLGIRENSTRITNDTSLFVPHIID